MTPQQIINRIGLAPGASAHPSWEAPMMRYLQYHPSPGHDGALKELTQQLGATVSHNGSDVHVLTGQLLNRKAASHASVKAMWWQWKHLFAVKWDYSSHINALEMRMILQTFLWKARKVDSVNKRWLHLEDSMVCLYILTKGRTSSHLLRPICKRIGSIQLALGVTALHARTPSDENPTDEASRR